jgi:hypothetical protein
MAVMPAWYSCDVIVHKRTFEPGIIAQLETPGARW